MSYDKSCQMYGSGSKQALIGAPGCKSLLIDQGVNKL